jgi:hypothetical protein
MIHTYDIHSKGVNLTMMKSKVSLRLMRKLTQVHQCFLTIVALCELSTESGRLLHYDELTRSKITTLFLPDGVISSQQTEKRSWILSHRRVPSRQKRIRHSVRRFGTFGRQNARTCTPRARRADLIRFHRAQPYPLAVLRICWAYGQLFVRVTV